jgi:hypothetical protein
MSTIQEVTMSTKEQKRICDDFRMSSSATLDYVQLCRLVTEHA